MQWQVDIYAINFTDKTYYFEYCGKRYNEIPPRSVIGQETYGNEVWEIVADDGVVMIQVLARNFYFILHEPCTRRGSHGRSAHYAWVFMRAFWGCRQKLWSTISAS